MTPFDYLKILHSKDIKWNQLTEEEHKSWNTFIINRALSFTSDYLDIINKIQPHTGGQLPSHIIFKYYQNMLPSKFRFQKWIKGSKGTKFNPDLVSVISDYFECSNKQAEDYLFILDKKEIKQALKIMGFQDSEIKKLTKK